MLRANPLRMTACFALLSLATGCCHFTERLNDRVDRIADSQPCFDDWYDSHLDLTREYRSDGGHHWLFRRCGCECEQCR